MHTNALLIFTLKYYITKHRVVQHPEIILKILLSFPNTHIQGYSMHNTKMSYRG